MGRRQMTSRPPRQHMESTLDNTLRKTTWTSRGHRARAQVAGMEEEMQRLTFLTRYRVSFRVITKIILTVYLRNTEMILSSTSRFRPHSILIHLMVATTTLVVAATDPVALMILTVGHTTLSKSPSHLERTPGKVEEAVQQRLPQPEEAVTTIPVKITIQWTQSSEWMWILMILKLVVELMTMMPLFLTTISLHLSLLEI